jgi:hypothetical protein
MYPSMIASVLSGFPDQLMLIWLKSRRSMGFHFEQPVG